VNKETKNSWQKRVSKKTDEILYQDKIDLKYPCDNENVVLSVYEIAGHAGFSEAEKAMIATAASELSTNILRFAKEGTIEISACRRKHDRQVIMSRLERMDRIERLEKMENEYTVCIEILADDNGPGIPDIELALKEGYSTIPASLGLGLTSVKRIMDEFYVESEPGKGTHIHTLKWRKDASCIA